MGIAAYKRGSRIISEQISRDYPVSPFPHPGAYFRKEAPQKNPDYVSRKQAIKWARLNWESSLVCGELNTTQLAENIAHAFDRDDWLDDETHWVWDVALLDYQL